MCMYWYGYDLVLGWLDACGLVSDEDVRRKLYECVCRRRRRHVYILVLVWSGVGLAGCWYLGKRKKGGICWGFMYSRMSNGRSLHGVKRKAR